MSHKIETIAWSNEKPWHTLGVEVSNSLTPQEIMKAAKLNWSLSKELLQTESGVKIPDYFALQRSSDKKVLDIVGKQYIPTQNAQAFQFFTDFVKAGKMKMETAGSLKGGKMVWALANIGNSFKLSGNDVTKGYILLASPHEQGKSLRVKFTAVRVVCNNTITMALNEDALGFRMTHRHSFNEDMQSLAKETLGLANDRLDTFADQAQKLAKKKVTKAQTAHFFTQVFQPELENAPIEIIAEKANKATSLAVQALVNAPGHDLNDGTAWSLLNAVTYTTDHLLGRSPDARLAKSWLGKNEALKIRALDLALAV